MKLLKTNKIDNIETTNCCGIPIYKLEKSQNSKLQEFCGGVLRTSKIWSAQRVEKSIEIFNVEVHRYKQELNDFTRFVFGIPVTKLKLSEKFCKKYKKIIRDRDFIIILHANIGEITVFLRLAEAYFKKLGAKNPLFIGLKPYHKDLVEMLCPNIPIKIIQKIKLPLYCSEYQTKEHNIKVIFTKTYYEKVEESLRDKNAPIKHFIKHILNYLKLSENDFSQSEIKITDIEKQEVLDKVKNIGLNVENFVFFSPEANTCADIGLERWLELKSEYESKGYDIFCNVSLTKDDYKMFKQCDLTLKEAYILASMSKEIVGLRSGLLDLLFLTKVPMRVFYNEARDRDGFNPLSKEEIEMGFGLT